jgi:hypothetical protein
MRTNMKGFKLDEIEKNSKKVTDNKLTQKMDLRAKIDQNSNDP